MKIICVLLLVIPFIICERIVLLNLTPEEAQKYIAAKSLDLGYARLLDEIPLSQARDITNREFYHNGRLIENPEEYIEKTYEANQFHGQDGLGRSMFGYTDWNQGRLEARNANGEVRGSYQYVDPYGENIVVNYWTDSLGFHQMDNRPKVRLDPVTETAEVQAARAAHEKAWEEAARAAQENPDPMSDIYNQNANRLDEEQSEIDQAMDILSGVANQQQSLTRYPNLPYDHHIKPIRNDASAEDSVVLDTNESKNQYRNKRQHENLNEEEEAPTEPKGFFYNVDYPVQLIVENNEGRKSRSAIKNEAIETESNKKLEVEDTDFTIVHPETAKTVESQNSIQRKRNDRVNQNFEIVTAQQQSKPVAVDKVQVVAAVRALEDNEKHTATNAKVTEVLSETKSKIYSEKLKDKFEDLTEVKTTINSEPQVEALIPEQKSNSLPKKVSPNYDADKDTLSIATKSETNIQSTEDENIEKKKLLDVDDITDETKQNKEDIIQYDSHLKHIPDHIPVEVIIVPEPVIRTVPILNKEAELKRLATDPDFIDAVHDVQLHPKQIG